jgi:hypothetical protein
LGQRPEDLTRRYNRQDLTRPGASNPQDLTTGGGGSGFGSSSGGSSGGGTQIAPGVPSIMVPETR